jgi:hypothetical protein
MSENNVRIQLENRMFDGFMSLNENKHVVLKDLNDLSEEQLLYIVKQYAQFPRNIVSILVSAAYNFGFHGWTSFVEELRDNVSQELGGGCGTIATEFGPHYSILRRELQNVFGVDVHETKPSAATNGFLDGLRHLVQTEPYEAAGSVFALEASAVPELGIMMKLVSHLASKYEKKLTPNLVKFFKFHLNVIEVGHRDRIIKRIESQLAVSDNLMKFVKGYDAVLEAMDTWWTDLTIEGKANHHELTLSLA